MEQKSDSPATLVAIIVAARRAGDRDLEREMKYRLQETHGVKLTFAAPRQEQPHDEVSHA